MRRTALVTLKIVRWRENAVGFSGWDGHTRAELKERLGNAINASPEELRDLWRRILKREAGVVINNVREDAAPGLWHIIETMGADITRE
jgi:hypothetical protein